mmetsp:Transcript_32267/g.74124  ORF Transcript_32267/g.74124 Transcript_32267/m.74124 type:complete len:633 (-) Transcript_32267:523-2421(-)
METTKAEVDPPQNGFNWIRGVNLNGWLVLKRYITPYLFAVTTCDIAGNFCLYPGQPSVPLMNGTTLALPPCDYAKCPPVMKPGIDPATGEEVQDFPQDEFTLMGTFKDNSNAAREYMTLHYDSFVTREDIAVLKESGVTHLRVPFGHWLVGDVADFVNATEKDKVSIMVGPWVPYLGWFYLLRLIGWCRAEGLQVWMEMDQVPGWDRPGTDCGTWSSVKDNVVLTMAVAEKFIGLMQRDGLDDVITGMTLLPNDLGGATPTEYCDIGIVEAYYNDSLALIRDLAGPEFTVTVGPAGIDPVVWNQDHIWQNRTYVNTFMESDYTQVYAPELRELSPRQHIAYACQLAMKNYTECCWADYINGTGPAIPALGISRLVGKWSAAYDTDVDAKTFQIMQAIAANGSNPEYDRELSQAQEDFLQPYVKAQMVAYELAATGISKGWFFETMKTEGGSFLEWDYIRGFENGWIPHLPDPAASSESVFGTCQSLLFETDDSMDIVNPFPATLEPGEQNVIIDDDVVLSHGESLPQEEKDDPKEVDESPFVEPPDDEIPTPPPEEVMEPPIQEIPTLPPNGVVVHVHTHHHHHGGGWAWWFALLALIFFIYAIKRVFFGGWSCQRRSQYEEVQNSNIGLTV